MMAFEMKPKANGETDMRVLLNVDPKIWFAPDMFINFIFKAVAQKFLTKIYSFSSTVHKKEWGKRMEENPAFYDLLRNVLDGYQRMSKV